MNILIVEDDKVLSLLLRKMVDKFGYNVIGTATAGREALEKARNLEPDLILMDIMLEDDVDGIEVMLSLREEKYEFPVIYITGNSDSYNRERAEDTNYIDYLVKPISFDILKSSINKIAS
jgi:DNA-binding response OmpR family regulator